MSNQINHRKKSSCTCCSMIRFIAYHDKFTVEITSYNEPKVIATISIKLCDNCLRNTFNSVIGYLTPSQLRNQVMYMAGKGNKG